MLTMCVSLLYYPCFDLLALLFSGEAPALRRMGGIKTLLPEECMPLLGEDMPLLTDDAMPRLEGDVNENDLGGDDNVNELDPALALPIAALDSLSTWAHKESSFTESNNARRFNVSTWPHAIHE